MATFVALFFSGIAFGAVLAVVALGFLVLHRATGIVNFAHGDLVTLGAYLAVWSIVNLHLPTLAAYAFTLLLMFGAGVLLERVAHAPLRGRHELTIIIATLAAALIIRGLLAVWRGPNPVQLKSPAGYHFITVLGASIAVQRIAIIIVAFLVIGALLYLFRYTRIGLQLRALAGDREMAQLVGIRDRGVSMFAFGLSATLAGLAGILIAPLNAVDLTFGFDLMITAFAAAVIGGFGSFGGVVLGGILIGLLQQLVGGYLFPNYSDTFPYIVLFLVIALFPSGLTRQALGRRL